MIRSTSCQAASSKPLMRTVLDYLRQRLGLALTYVDELSWEACYQELGRGGIHLAWICGAPYVRYRELAASPVQLLAAPVWRAPRYGDRPVYFSDVIVRAAHPAQSFADLARARWAYNEPGSLSGYEIVRYYLAQQNLSHGFFGQAIQSGAHVRSIAMVLAGEVDASAIDSTVLEEEVRVRPELETELRVIDVIGPNPMPPWVAASTMPPALCADLRAALVEMHTTVVGAAMLAATPIARFAAVDDADYDPVRTALRLAETVRLT